MITSSLIVPKEDHIIMMGRTKLLFGICLAIFICNAAACSCVMPDSCLDRYENETIPLIKARAKRTLNVADSDYTYTLFEYNFVFRGCTPSKHQFIVKTPSTEEKCGVEFKPNHQYLLTIRLAGGATPPPAVSSLGCDMYTAVSCDYNQPWYKVPYGDANKLYYSEHRGCEV